MRKRRQKDGGGGNSGWPVPGYAVLGVSSCATARRIQDRLETALRRECGSVEECAAPLSRK